LLPASPLPVPPSPQNRYDAASGKNVAVPRLALIRSTPRLRCLVVSLTVRPVHRPLTTRPMKRPASQQVAAPLLQASSTDSSHLLTSPPRSTKAASVPDLLRHHYVTTASSCCRSPLRLVWVQGGIGAGADCAAIRPMEKMPHPQLVPRSRMAQRFTGSGFKIATDTAGMLGSSEKPLQDQAVRSRGANGENASSW